MTISTQQILAEVERRTGISPADIRSGNRSRPITAARRLAALALRHIGRSLPEIAALLWLDSHTSVLHYGEPTDEARDVVREATSENVCRHCGEPVERRHECSTCRQRRRDSMETEQIVTRVAKNRKQDPVERNARVRGLIAKYHPLIGAR